MTSALVFGCITWSKMWPMSMLELIQNALLTIQKTKYIFSLYFIEIKNQETLNHLFCFNFQLPEQCGLLVVSKFDLLQPQ